MIALKQQTEPRTKKAGKRLRVFIAGNKLTEGELIEQARAQGRKAWELRHVLRNPFDSCKHPELYAAWNAGRDEARRASETRHQPAVVGDRDATIERMCRQAKYD